MQNPSNVGEEAKKIPVNHPYIGVVAGDDTLSFFVVAERQLVLSTNSFFRALRGIMASYYIFNIEYPKELHMTLIFIQHFIFCIKEVNLPQAVIRSISSLDKL